MRCYRCAGRRREPPAGWGPVNVEQEPYIRRHVSEAGIAGLNTRVREGAAKASEVTPAFCGKVSKAKQFKITTLAPGDNHCSYTSWGTSCGFGGFGGYLLCEHKVNAVCIRALSHNFSMR